MKIGILLLSRNTKQNLSDKYLTELTKKINLQGNLTTEVLFPSNNEHRDFFQF